MNIPKFRAWIKAKKEMHDVLLIDWLNGLVDLAYSNIELDFNDVILMQSTGLKDKNGVEIFEGDIIDVGNGFINKVDYRLNDGCWRLKSVNGRCLCSYFSNYDSKEEWVIIGNIYENSELLED